MSNYKNSNAAKTTITRNTSDLYSKVDGNLFEAVVLLAKRSNQISRHYERLPKPHSIAVQELLEDKVFYRYPEENNQ